MAKDSKNLFERAKERIDEAKEHMREQHERIREDLRFSNPADPQQWSDADATLRNGRPTLTLDRTNQFIRQVSNDMRQNKPGIQVIGVDSKADPKAADVLSGLIKYIEYKSRADHAYDTAGDLAVRCGLGWLRVITKEVNPETKEQELVIMRITDPTSCGLDPNSTDADGADAQWGYVETRISERAFKAQYPKAKQVPMGDAGWQSDGFLTIAEYFEIEECTTNYITFVNERAEEEELPEDEYWDLVGKFGVRFEELGAQKRKEKRVIWAKLSGAELLEPSTYFPGECLPIVPVLGSELWVDGKRHVCGLTRQLMDGQRLHNFQMSAMAEFLASQPKAPFLVPFEGLDGFENDWKKLNRGNPAYLPYNAFDDSGNAIPAPSRLNPPAMPGAYAQMAQFAVTEMEASVGMYKSALGQQSNAVSGRAKLADERSSDTSTFHFIDNLSRSIEQLGRVIIGAAPIVFDTDRTIHIVGINDERDMVRINPTSSVPSRQDQKGKVIEINPSIGKYDVRAKAGPSYTTQRVETAQQLSDMISAQPQLAPVLGPMWAKLKDMPESDTIARLLTAMAPPPVQALLSEDEEIPPQAQQKIQQLEQQLQEMHQMIDMASTKLEEANSKDKELTLKYLNEAAARETEEYRAETERLKVLGPAITPEQIALIAQKAALDAINREPLADGEEFEHVAQAQAGLQDDPHAPPMEMPEPGEPPEINDDQNEPPTGGFSLPEQEVNE